MFGVIDHEQKSCLFQFQLCTLQSWRVRERGCDGPFVNVAPLVKPTPVYSTSELGMMIVKNQYDKSTTETSFGA